jgi:hypothetical protein
VHKLKTELSPGTIMQYEGGFQHKLQAVYPGASKHVPFLHIEFLADPFDVFDKIPGSVLLQTGAWG